MWCIFDVCALLFERPEFVHFCGETFTPCVLCVVCCVQVIEEVCGRLLTIKSFDVAAHLYESIEAYKNAIDVYIQVLCT